MLPYFCFQINKNSFRLIIRQATLSNYIELLRLVLERLLRFAGNDKQNPQSVIASEAKQSQNFIFFSETCLNHRH